MPTGRGNDRVPPDLRIEVGMNINETRGNELSVSVEDTLASVRDFANLSNAITLYRYVGAIRLTAGTIDDCSILNDDIVDHAVLLLRIHNDLLPSSFVRNVGGDRSTVRDREPSVNGILMDES